MNYLQGLYGATRGYVNRATRLGIATLAIALVACEGQGKLIENPEISGSLQCAPSIAEQYIRRGFETPSFRLSAIPNNIAGDILPKGTPFSIKYKMFPDGTFNYTIKVEEPLPEPVLNKLKDKARSSPNAACPPPLELPPPPRI